MVLNIGLGVVPELRAQILLGERDDLYEPIVHLHLRFDETQARYVAEFVGLQGPDITGTDLREVRVGEYLRAAAAGGIFLPAKTEDEVTVSLLDAGGDLDYTLNGQGDRIRAAGPVDWVLRFVAESYQIAQLSAQAPAKAVERQLGIPARTAARWISKAKDLGILVRPAVPGQELDPRSAALYDRIAAANRGDLPWEAVGGIHEVTMEDLEHGEHL